MAAIENPLPTTIDGKNPRRCQQEHWHEVEQDIHAVTTKVHELGQDPILTQVISLLGEARNRVADYLEGQCLAPAEEAPAS